MEKRVGISFGPERVSALLLWPDDAKALFVFAHPLSEVINRAGSIQTRLIVW